MTTPLIRIFALITIDLLNSSVKANLDPASRNLDLQSNRKSEERVSGGSVGALPLYVSEVVSRVLFSL